MEGRILIASNEIGPISSLGERERDSRFHEARNAGEHHTHGSSQHVDDDGDDVSS